MSMSEQELRRALEVEAGEYVSSEWDRFNREFKELRVEIHTIKTELHSIKSRTDTHDRLIGEYRASITELSNQISMLIKELHAAQLATVEYRLAFEKFKEDLAHCGEDKERKIDAVIAGFPNKDPKGHLQFHEKLIRKAEEEAEIAKETKKRVFSGATWAALSVTALALWEFIRSHLR